jgi:hypothetical protein
MTTGLDEKQKSESKNATEIVKLVRAKEPEASEYTGAVIVLRPSTPEEQKKKCLNCSGMEDFIKGLQ